MHLAQRPKCLFAVAIAALLTLAAPAPALAANGKGADIAGGWTVFGATVTAPGQPTQHWDDTHAAAFLQSWLPASMLPANVGGGLPDAPPPPKKLTLYTITVSDTINGAPNKIVSYYASDGRIAWVSMPPQELGGGAFVSQQHWFYTPARTIDAFAGKVQPEAVPPPVTSAPDSPNAAKSRGSTAWIWILGAAALLIVIGAIVVLVRRRPSQPGGPGEGGRDREPARI